jgi:RNA polymerase sigma-70 factor (ECF subfamily)
MDERAERLARGDREAFAALYDACADRVHRYLVVRLGSRADADDVLQETFVRLARARNKLANVDDLTAYVFAAARNESIRFIERLGRQNQRAAEAVFEEAGSDDLQKRESAEWVAAALAGLTPELREVVVLKIYGDLTFREIAEVTGLPQGTAATRYRTALEQLRGRMTKELE